MSSSRFRMGADTFWLNVQRGTDDECWPWLRPPTPGTGYGQARVAGRHLLAHRLAWSFTHGPVPLGMFVLHKCDVRLCVNPNHLFLGTQADNVRDMIAKGRQAVGAATRSTPLTDALVREMRTLRAAGTPHRDLCNRFGVSEPTVSRICNRVTWRHV